MPDLTERAPPEKQVRNLLALLRWMVVARGVTNRSVEEKLGVSYGYLSRLFAGSIELKARHLFEIFEALGMDAAEFFHLAFPLPPRSRALDDFRKAAGLPSPQAPPSLEEIEKLVREILRTSREDGPADG
ncbi:MAG TPA: helix-turn-helix transcriptional regulator [Thermoanaerobaculia bacterium]